MTHRRRGSLGHLRSALLTVSAAIGVLCLIGLLAGLVFGVHPMVVTSGSMSPTIPAGSLVVAKDTDAADVEVGDVVAVSAGDGRVMHRVVHVVPAGDGSGQTVLTLKGDANGTPDSQPYVVRRVGEVRFHVPWLGYPITWLSTPWGLMGLGVGACGLLVFAFRRTSAPTPGRRRVAALFVVPVGAALVALTASPSSAMFTDTGTVTSDASTHTVVSQAQPTCTDVNGFLGLGNIARLTWTHVDARYEYFWELRTTGGTPVSSGTVGGGQAVGSTVTLDISTGLVGTNANYNVVVRARLRTSTSWIATATTTTQVRRASVLVIGVSMRCGWA